MSGQTRATVGALPQQTSGIVLGLAALMAVVEADSDRILRGKTRHSSRERDVRH